MDDALRQHRCSLLAPAIVALMPALIEGKSHPARLREALPALQQIRAIAEQGADGIDNAAYATWVSGAGANLASIEAAVTAGDADAAFAAFRDAQTGLHLLTQGCEGTPGW